MNTSKGWGGCSAVFIAALILCVRAAPAAADDKAIYVPSATAADIVLPAQTVTTDTFNAAVPMYVRNEHVGSIKVDGLLVGPDGENVPIKVTRRSASGAQQVADAALPIVAGEPVDLAISGRLPAPGDYVLSARVLTADGKLLGTIGGKVQRAASPFPSDGVVANPPVSLFSGGDDVAVDVPLTGLADRDLGFTVGAVRITRSVAAGEVGGGGVTATAGTCPGTVPTRRVLTRGSADKLRVRLCGPLRPGDYHVRFDLIGDGGGLRSVEVEMKYAYSWLFATVMIALGGLIGAPLAWWRASGSEQADGLLSLDRIRTDVVELSSRLGTSSRQAQLAPLLDAIDKCRNDVAADGRSAALTAQITDLTNRRDLLNRILWQVARAGPLASNSSVDAALGDALGAVGSRPSVEAAPLVDALAKAVDTARAGALQNVSLTASADVSGTIDPPSFHLFTGRESRIAILRKRGIANLAASIVLFLLFLLTAVLSLWFPNPTWGGTSDLILAFLTGIAAFGGIATQLGTFKTAVQQVK